MRFLAVALAFAFIFIPGAAAPETARPPMLVTLEAPAESTETAVVLREVATGRRTKRLSTLVHALGSARRATLAPGRPLRTFVIAREPLASPSTTYGSALFRLDEDGKVTRLRGGLTDASRALFTASGTLLVQAGQDGQSFAPKRKVLRERVDQLTIEAVDPEKGTSRVVWSSQGMIAFLAAPLAGDEALIFHVHSQGAALFALDAKRGTVRSLIPELTPLARDFSYDRSSETLAFARKAARGSAYEVVTLSADGTAKLSVRFLGNSDRLVPSVLPGGDLALSLPQGGGLAFLSAKAKTPTRAAPLGEGVDEVLAASGPFLALRHRTPSDERTVVFDRRSGQVLLIAGPELEVDVAGFVDAGAP